MDQKLIDVCKEMKTGQQMWFLGLESLLWNTSLRNSGYIVVRVDLLIFSFRTPDIIGNTEAQMFKNSDGWHLQ